MRPALPPLPLSPLLLLPPLRPLAAALVSLVALLPLAPASARADETQACIDASDQGQTLRIDKHLREARTAFARCAQARCPDAVRTKCAEWLDQTQTALPTIVFVVKDAAGNDVSPVRVTLDGAVVTERYDGTALSANPGEHAFRFDWEEGKGRATRVFRLVEGEKDRLERIVFAPAGAVREEKLGEESASNGGAQRTAGVVVGVAGLAGLALGGAFGIAAITKNDAAGCDAANVCADPQARRDAQGVATASTIAFTAGAVALAAGVILYLVAPRSSPSRGALLSPLVTLDGRTTVGLGGTF